MIYKLIFSHIYTFFSVPSSILLCDFYVMIFSLLKSTPAVLNIICIFAKNNRNNKTSYMSATVNTLKRLLLILFIVALATYLVSLNMENNL